MSGHKAVHKEAEDKTSKRKRANSRHTDQRQTMTQSCGNPSCVEGGTKRCARCLKICYCSRECQVAHHHIHKATCRAPSTSARRW